VVLAKKINLTRGYIKMKTISKKYRLPPCLLAIPVLAILTVTSESEAINWQDILNRIISA
jgi:hypothetical protein